MSFRFVGLLVAVFVCCLLMNRALCAQTLPANSKGNPDFGPNVLIFDPSTPDIQKQVDAVFATQESGQFNTNRYALLFKPGKYDADVQVGFYTQVAGLGRSPDDVEIRGAVRSTAKWRRGNATCNFWRCVENLSLTPTLDEKVDVWAVSQGTALRRVHVEGDLNLSDHGWSSGGFIADSKIDGRIDSGSQQQWLSRNSQWGQWVGGSWNMVFVGTVNPPSGDWPEKPYTVVEKTPLIREKPFLFVDGEGKWFVGVPGLEAAPSRGIGWGESRPEGPRFQEVPIEGFYIAHAERDTAASINAALEAGKNLLLTPGIYHLSESVRVNRPGTIVLGLGYPTLSAEKGATPMVAGDVDGVKVGGILFEAGETESQTLLQVGDEKSSASHASDPICLYDIFCRAGGAVAGKTRAFVTINSSNVVGDNFWLWRADHGTGAKWNVNENRNGLIVNGNDVTLYGLFVEHCQEYQTVWNGNGGRVYFYQSEMPYDPPSTEAWSHDGVRGFASYKIGDKVTSHQAWGLGVYCVFYAGPVIAETAIETPAAAGVKLHHMITIRLNGKPGSGINHVMNQQGDPVIDAKVARLN